MRVNLRYSWACQNLCSPPYTFIRYFLFCVFICLCVLAVGAVTVMETRFIQQKSYEFHPRKRHSQMMEVAVATDVLDDSLSYGVVVDCGSSGSRVFVYFWTPHSGKPGELLNVQLMMDEHVNPVVRKIEPGLSEYSENPSEASAYIRPLLDFAVSHIPKSKHKQTPLYIFATAGMRLLPLVRQKAIMDDLKVDIPLRYNFLISENSIQVISGKQEGVYGWISINYILGKFEHHHSAKKLNDEDERIHSRKKTVGMLDMGGGSAQIAFELPKSEHADKDLLAEFNLGCASTAQEHKYQVYVATFLGFGSNIVWKKYLQNIGEIAVRNNQKRLSHLSIAENVTKAAIRVSTLDPCLPPDLEESVQINETLVTIRGTGNFDSCTSYSKVFLNKDVTCDNQPCSIGGIHQPIIDFTSSKFFGLSEFYYTMEDLFHIGGKYSFANFHQKAKEFCATHWLILLSWYRKNLYPRADLNRFRRQCFKSAWLVNILHDGLGFPHSNIQLTSAQLINGREVHWTLGALIHKTRYYPLQAIQKGHLGHARMRNTGLPPTYTILGCIFIVFVMIGLYFWHLKSSHSSTLARSPSKVSLVNFP